MNIYINVYYVYFQLVVVSQDQLVVDLVFGNNVYALEVALSYYQSPMLNVNLLYYLLLFLSL